MIPGDSKLQAEHTLDCLLVQILIDSKLNIETKTDMH